MIREIGDLPDVRLPRYEQLRDALRTRVTSGEWPPGSALRSEADLAKQYKVALGTMRQAIARAVDDGLLERVHGKGTFVRAELQDALMFRFFRFRGSADDRRPTVPRAVIHELGEVRLEDAIAERLHCRKGSRGIFMRRARILADTGAKRSSTMPDLPTMAEAGVPGYEVYEWNVLLAPAGTPAAIVSKLQAEVKKVLDMKDVHERVESLGGEVVASTPAETDIFLRSQIEKWAKVVKAADIKVD